MNGDSTNHDRKGRFATDYKPEYVEVARAATQLGATMNDLAGVFKCTLRTIHNWRAQYPDFAEAIRVGKDIADERVVASLYQRAVGSATRAPNVVACIFWLKNRRPEEWRDVKGIEWRGTLKRADLHDLTDDELERRYAELQRRIAAITGDSERPALPPPGEDESSPVH